jgi:hypothetical protein
MRRKCGILLLGIVLVLGCRDHYVVQPVAPRAEIGTDWTVLTPPKALLWSKPVEELAFLIDSPHQIGEHLEVVGPKGEKFVPEVQLLSPSGKWYQMDSHGILGEEMFFTLRNGSSDLTSFNEVRIRSDVPITISKVLWRGYDPNDVKR